jgi:hypothetical protein
MTHNNLNTAQSLLAHIALKTERLKLFGADILVKQWRASERIKFMAIITDSKADLNDEVAMIRPQSHIVALSMVDDKGAPLFPAKWKDGQPVFVDQAGVESLVQNRTQECYEAFVEISKFNGVVFSNADEDDIDEEEIAAKN